MSQCSINPSDTPIEREYRRIKDASLNKLSRRYSPLEHPPRVTAPASYLALRTAYHSNAVIIAAGRLLAGEIRFCRGYGERAPLGAKRMKL